MGTCWRCILRDVQYIPRVDSTVASKTSFAGCSTSHAGRAGLRVPHRAEDVSVSHHQRQGLAAHAHGGVALVSVPHNLASQLKFRWRTSCTAGCKVLSYIEHARPCTSSGSPAQLHGHDVGRRSASRNHSGLAGHGSAPRSLPCAVP